MAAAYRLVVLDVTLTERGRGRYFSSSRLTGLVARHQRGKARPGAAKSEPRTLGGPVVNLRTVAPIEQPSIGDSARHQSHQAFSLIGCAFHT